MKTILGIHSAPAALVGDGFPVRSCLATTLWESISVRSYCSIRRRPVHAGDAARGVGQHPHRGFETVTIVYAGEVEHRDSSGARR